MPSIDTLAGVTRTIQPVIWIIDTSASMAGEKVEIIEWLFSDYTKILNNLSLNDTEIKTGVLKFNTDFCWADESGLMPVDSEAFNSFHLSPKGITNVGVALYELNSKLSRKELFKDGKYHAPILAFILDGHSTDNYKSALELLKENKWFQNSIKTGLAIGSEADVKLLTDIVGEEGLFTDPSQFAVMLKKLLAQYNRKDEDLSYDENKSNTERIKPIMGENIILPSFVEPNEPEMFIDINHIEYQMCEGKYKIVRCQLSACDLGVADQVCFIANVLPDKKSVRLVNVDLVQDNLYMMRFSLSKNQTIELGIDLLDSMIIFGNIQIHIKNNDTFDIQGMSEHSDIAVFLDHGKQIILKIGEKYEIETPTSKVSITINDGWLLGDDWD